MDTCIKKDRKMIQIKREREEDTNIEIDRKMDTGVEIDKDSEI